MGEWVRITFSTRSYNRLQDLLVVKDENETLRGANDERGCDGQTGGPAKVALADFGEELGSDDLQLCPAHDVPWGLGCVGATMVSDGLEEVVAGQRGLARVLGQEGRRGAARGRQGRGRQRQARGEAAVKGLKVWAVGARGVVRVGEAGVGRGDEGALNGRGVVGGRGGFEAGGSGVGAGKGEAIGAVVGRVELPVVYGRVIGLIGLVMSAGVAQARFEGHEGRRQQRIASRIRLELCGMVSALVLAVARTVEASRHLRALLSQPSTTTAASLVHGRAQLADR